MAPARPLWRTGFFLPSLIALGFVAVMAAWAVSRSTRPLRDLTRAAERFGVDMDAPPMIESGPREVRRAAQAFNTMQGRLRAFVRDRTRMLAAISHDLRTPITRMRLRAEFVDDDEQREKMLADLDEMEAMIAATLRFAKDDAQSETPGILDLAAMARELCADARRAGFDVVGEGSDTLAFKGREVALKRMLSNLVDNAVRYGKRARVRWDSGDGVVRLVVRDDGPGIPSEEAERVFDPFVRLETSRSRETGGTGLGLTAVKSAVQAHGGRIELRNHPEGGLEAVVELPVSIS
ncbi:MAG: HAMP domain-containing protein [Alphaproteobacteria bacterium]|nr:HAMP domain-containing protein [Alphaproteobacteria bacterium]